MSDVALVLPLTCLYRHDLKAAIEPLFSVRLEHSLSALDIHGCATLIVDLDARDADIDSLAQWRRRYPQPRLILISSTPPDSLIASVLKLQVYHLIHKSTPNLQQELLTVLLAAENSEAAFALSTYMQPGYKLSGGTLETRDDRLALIDKGIEFFKEHNLSEEQLINIRLTLDELINNALYHAFHVGLKAEKYDPATFVAMRDSDEIFVQFGIDGKCALCSVLDNAGSLRPDTIMATLARQISLQGLMDERGRGLFLIRTLSDKMLINLYKDRMTQIITCFNTQPGAEHKPLYINSFE